MQNLFLFGNLGSCQVAFHVVFTILKHIEYETFEKVLLTESTCNEVLETAVMCSAVQCINLKRFTFTFDRVLGKVISESYVLEYGTDCLEMHVNAILPGEHAVIIDDLVATGGTLSAAIRLLGESCNEHPVITFCPFFLK